MSDNKLSDDKLSDNNLASELVGNRSFLKPIKIEEIVIFMINMGIKFYLWSMIHWFGFMTLSQDQITFRIRKPCHEWCDRLVPVSVLILDEITVPKLVFICTQMYTISGDARSDIVWKHVPTLKKDNKSLISKKKKK